MIIIILLFLVHNHFIQFIVYYFMVFVLFVCLFLVLFNQFCFDILFSLTHSLTLYRHFSSLCSFFHSSIHSLHHQHHYHHHSIIIIIFIRGFICEIMICLLVFSLFSRIKQLILLDYDQNNVLLLSLLFRRLIP